MLRKLLAAAVLFHVVIAATAQHTIDVNLGGPAVPVPATMWGIFFEDINMGADGGIYAELVKNRSFEFFRPMMGWKVLGKPQTEGDFEIINRSSERTANPRFLRVTLHNNAKGSIGLVNEGFRGMGIKKDLAYHFSLQYRKGAGTVQLHLALVNESGQSIGETALSLDNGNNEWKKEKISFTASATSMKAKLNIWFEGDGMLDLDMISLFPSDTWKNRPGGMRADMVQKLADLKPGFIRFPGGCIVEGFDLSTRYQWKKTIGPLEERQLIINRWNTEFADRQAPDYFQSFGLGFFEYFQLAEDIGAQALPILNCGMACQFNSSELVPLADLGPYVQDALDLVEFANGDTQTKWGSIRAAMGHPAPFNLQMIGIGNENWGPQYLERLAVFSKAIKEKYPEIKLVNSSGTDPMGARFDYLNAALRATQADLIDEHYYRPPQWFFSNAKRYDNYPRTGSRVFAGEYASHMSWDIPGEKRNCWLSALSEAAFMTGLERNADVVHMASYAPLFAHAEGWQWSPDLIWVNNLQSYGSPDYYVQQLFSTNKGNRTVSTTMNNEPIAGQDSLYASSVFDSTSRELIVKLVNAGGKQQPVTLLLKGVKLKSGSNASIQEMQNNDLLAVNSFDQPNHVAPGTRTMPLKSNNLSIALKPYSFSVLHLPVK
jgi:alpha-L-arabinofuranosidase